MKMNKTIGLRIFVGIVSVAMAAAAITGLILAGSPAEERMRRLDDRRLSDLQSISYAVDQFWNNEDRLPADLDELLQNRDVFVQSVNDPETGAPYEYRKLEGAGYELCATFQTVSRAKEMPEPYVSGRQNDFWDHEAGRKCYELEARSYIR